MYGTVRLLGGPKLPPNFAFAKLTSVIIALDSVSPRISMDAKFAPFKFTLSPTTYPFGVMVYGAVSGDRGTP